MIGSDDALLSCWLGRPCYMDHSQNFLHSFQLKQVWKQHIPIQKPTYESLSDGGILWSIPAMLGFDAHAHRHPSKWQRVTAEQVSSGRFKTHDDVVTSTCSQDVIHPLCILKSSVHVESWSCMNVTFKYENYVLMYENDGKLLNLLPELTKENGAGDWTWTNLLEQPPLVMFRHCIKRVVVVPFWYDTRPSKHLPQRYDTYPRQWDTNLVP